jgi:hypothetical protein
VRRPALPLRHRHGYAADIHRGLLAGNHMATKEFSTTRRQQIRTATSPYPPDLSWWAVKGRQSLISRVHLPVALTGPAPPGGADTSRRCQGCSHPPQRLPGQAAPSFTRPLRRSLTSARLQTPRGAHDPRPSRYRRTTFITPRARVGQDQQRGGDSQRPNGQVLTKTNPGHDIPAAVTSPHDQRAHGLLQDLTEDQRPRVLTRQPLPEPSLPNSPGKSH